MKKPLIARTTAAALARPVADQGVRKFAVNAGGDMRVRGGGWRVGIQHPTSPTADAYATAAFAMGAELAPHWTARLRGYAALTILSDGRMLSTPSLRCAA